MVSAYGIKADIFPLGLKVCYESSVTKNAGIFGKQITRETNCWLWEHAERNKHGNLINSISNS